MTEIDVTHAIYTLLNNALEKVQELKQNTGSDQFSVATPRGALKAGMEINIRTALACLRTLEITK